MEMFLKKLSLFAILLSFFAITSRAQIKELACPAGQSAVQSMNTTDPANGQVRENFCVDRNGVMTANTGVAGSTFAVGIIDTTSPKYSTPIGNTIPDATFTNGVATIDCTFSNDCNFVASIDNGKICFGTNFTTDISILNPTSVVLPEGTLTVTDAQHATCSGGNSTATTVHNGTFVWGKLGHTQLNSAWADCNTANGCNYQLPPGPVLVEAPVGNAECIQCLEAVGYGRRQVRGFGQTISQLIPTPNLSGAACNGGPAGDLNGCFFSASSIQQSDWGIFGAGQANLGAGFNGKVGMIIQGGGGPGGFANVYMNSMLLLSWGATTTGFTGIKAESVSAATLHDIHNDGFGNLNCLFSNPNPANALFTLEGTYCAVSSSDSLQVTAGTLSSHGGIYGYSTAASGHEINCTGTGVICSFDGDSLPYNTGTGGVGIISQTGAIVNLNSVIVQNSSTGGFGLATFSGGVTPELRVRDSLVSSTVGTDTALLVQASTKVFLEGGNRFVAAGGGTAINNAGQLFFSGTDSSYQGTLTGVVPTCTVTGAGATGSCAADAGSTNEKGTVLVTAAGAGPAALGTVVLTFQGSFSGPSAQSPTCTWTLDDTGNTNWNARATVIKGPSSTASATVNWDNNAVALVAANTLRLGYTCTAR